VADDAENSPGSSSEAEQRNARRAAALGAMAAWAVPLQWIAIVATGGLALYFALSGRWQVWDWVFVGLCALYVANAIGFRWLRKRNVR